MRILKFGGKSLASLEKMQKICKYIKKIYKNDKKIVVIVSAMGNSTDSLIELSKEFGGEKISKRELAVLLSTGETKSSSLFAMLLSNLNVPAKSFQGYQLQTTTYGGYESGRIAYINKSIIDNCINNETVAVIAGFQGINRNGEITTLGRGGSDTTAAAIGVLYDEKVEIYSDFDGVFAGDPKEYNFKKLKQIDFNSMLNLAEGGAKVIDGRATSLAKDFEIELISKSSSEPEKCGTVISAIEKDIISLAVIDRLTQITIVVTNPEREIGRASCRERV